MIAPRTLIAISTPASGGDIAVLIRWVLGAPTAADVLVVDDSSCANTAALLVQLAADNDRLRVICRGGGLGPGTAHKMVIRYALEHGYDVLVTLEGDQRPDPEAIPRLLHALQDADCAVAFQDKKAGSVGRRALHSLANRTVRHFLRSPLPEPASSFRAYRVARLRDLPLEAIQSDGRLFFLESHYWLLACGFRCRGVPVCFRRRTAGRPRTTLRQVVTGVRTLLRIARHRLLRYDLPRAADDISEHACYYCRSLFLAPKYRPSGGTDGGPMHVECTSMAHHVKPPVVECLECGLCYVPPSHYAQKQIVRLYQCTEDTTYLEYRGARRRTFRQVYRKIAPHLPEPGRLLEIGSYCGFFLEIARQHGWASTGIEPSEWAAAYARRELNLDVRAGTLDSLAGGLDDAYDVIVAWDVFEHLEDPVAELRKVWARLRSGGRFCFSTLDIDNWFPRLLGRRWPWLMEMHLFYYSRCTMTRILETVGFEVVDVKPYCHHVSLRYFFLKLCALLGPSADAHARILARLLPERPYVPFRFGDIKLFVCRKVAEPVVPPIAAPRRAA
jgi:SAM-dependent methyltransferase